MVIAGAVVVVLMIVLIAASTKPRENPTLIPKRIVEHVPTTPGVAWVPGTYECYAVTPEGVPQRQTQSVQTTAQAPPATKAPPERGGQSGPAPEPGTRKEEPPAPAALTHPITLDQPTLAGVKAHGVRIADPLARRTATVLVASQSCDIAKPMRDILGQSSRPPAVAIAGTHFCKESLRPVGTIVADGKALVREMIGCALVIKPTGQVSFIDVRGRNDWEGDKTVLAAGPRLLRGGVVAVDTSDFDDPHVLGAASRTAVTMDASNALILVVVPSEVSLGTAAQMLLDSGGSDGMLLDGGGSLCLYCGRQYLIQPGRNLTNLLVAWAR